MGCPKNRVDSEKTLGALKRAGLRIVTDESQADIIITNTCGFVADAKEESVDTILEMAQIKKDNPNVKLAVMGCLSERYRDELKANIPEIDHLYGTAELETIIADLAPEKAHAAADPDTGSRIITTSRHWAYLKIAEGCSNKCTFCVIPSIRGPYKSVDMEPVVAEAANLAARGVKELVVVAQDTTLYGADLKMKNGLASLLRKLAQIDGIQWIRTMYMYPALINDGLLDVFAGEGKVVPYFDIPLQHASNRILKSMGRPETNSSIRTLLENIRAKVPGAAIRTSFITGFPGERDEDFNELLRLVEDARFDHMGAFTYSPEEGTPAIDMEEAVDPEAAAERLEILMQAQAEISAGTLNGKVGKVYEILVDDPKPEEPLLTGRLATQAPEIDGCVILDGVEAEPGTFIKTLITQSSEYDLVGVAA